VTTGTSTALVVAPHGDDEVLGAGGLIAGLTLSRVRVRVVFFAVDASTHYGIDGATTLQQRLDEIACASRLLRYEYRIVFQGEGLLERLDTVPQRTMVDLLEDELDAAKPDIVLLPDGNDYDQDHRACFQAGLAATRPMPRSVGKHLVPRVMTYESPKLGWSQAFQPTAYYDVSELLETKLQAISVYGSQLRAEPHVRSLENIRALARLRGGESGVTYAEGFRVLRWLM
jgi:LmbE family N-acetylglucosaminyl deacetylase